MTTRTSSKRPNKQAREPATRTRDSITQGAQVDYSTCAHCDIRGASFEDGAQRHFACGPLLRSLRAHRRARASSNKHVQGLGKVRREGLGSKRERGTWRGGHVMQSKGKQQTNTGDRNRGPAPSASFFPILPSPLLSHSVSLRPISSKPQSLSTNGQPPFFSLLTPHHYPHLPRLPRSSLRIKWGSAGGTAAVLKQASHVAARKE